MIKFFKNIFSRFGESSDLLKFLWKEKLWFLIPFIAILLVFGFIFVFAQATGVAPFIYSLF